MRIWLLKTGEMMPTDGAHERPARTALLANALVARGHEVVWWTSTFNHQEKRQRGGEATVAVSEAYTIRFLHGRSYTKNRSYRRLQSERDVARRFANLARREPAPDVILAHMPSIDLSLQAATYARSMGVPIVVDIRDLWPEIFVYALPAPVRALGVLALQREFAKLRQACAAATAIFGITEEFLDWGLRHAGRTRQPLDRSFPLGYRPPSLSAHQRSAALAFWHNLGVGRNSGQIVASYIASFGDRNEQEQICLIDVARTLRNEGIQFVLCGDGPSLQRYKDAASGDPHIIFPGWVGAPELWALMHLSTVGLLPYENAPDFAQSLPNKVIEYFSGGLPVISSAPGVVKSLLSTESCGITYPNCDRDALRAALLRCRDDQGSVAEMAQNARRLFERGYHADAVYADMVSHLEKIAAGGMALAAAG